MNAGEPARRVLVIGDWMVDEHWVIGIHRSPTSSRTGKFHYRALHPPSATVESLCGAGRTASVLHQATLGTSRFCEIVGVGLWHPDDTAALTALLDPCAGRGETPHRLTRIATSPVGSRLFNLNPVLPDPSQCGTTRMIRIYQQTGARFSLLQRIDWELQIPQAEIHREIQNPEAEIHGGNAPVQETVWIQNGEALERSDLAADLDAMNAEHPFAAVVIKDMHKGVVSKALVKWLASHFARASWFVSTKAWQPRWFDDLPAQSVRLLVVPHVAAQVGARSGTLNRWITRSGNPSKGALEALDRLGTRFPKAIVVALPEGMSVLARDRARDDRPRIGVVQPEEEPGRSAPGMPMASVFFAALIAQLLHDNGMELCGLLQNGLRFTHQWMSIEVERVEKPEEWQPRMEQVLNLCEPSTSHSGWSGKPFDGRCEEFDWQRAIDEWQDAVRLYGIIGSNGSHTPGGRSKLRLELGRAMTEVDGYVCCSKEKREILQKVVNELKLFQLKDRAANMSCMLIASPGSGKTFLVRRLAEAVKLRFLGFNITQMIHKSDLLDCFDTIVTNQVQNRQQALLVFVDEINAKLDSQHVYDTFLAPLEGDVYVRAGKTFHIDPCVWVFAGTEQPTSQPDATRDKSDKASDFESRLTLPPLDLKVGSASEDQVEKVYLGVSLLREVFPDVRRVSKKVLQAFHTLPRNLEARKIKHFVESFVDIQYGEVRARNLNMDRFRELCENVSAWGDQPERETEMIAIVG
jgi:ATPase family associated with various cellular activities (AAA)